MWDKGEAMREWDHRDPLLGDLETRSIHYIEDAKILETRSSHDTEDAKFSKYSRTHDKYISFDKKTMSDSSKFRSINE